MKHQLKTSFVFLHLEPCYARREMKFSKNPCEPLVAGKPWGLLFLENLAESPAIYWETCFDFALHLISLAWNNFFWKFW